MGLTKNKTGRRFTYKEYCSWPEDERWELIDGVAYDMSPAPSRKHQEISGELCFQIQSILRKQKCKVYSAPFDVVLPQYPIENDDESDTVVQPDISVICDQTKLTEKGCLGAPDLIIEILSPSTSKKDLNEKFRLYEKQGVKEYWIVDPGNKYINVFHLIVDKNEVGKYDEGTLVPPSDWHDKNTIAESLVLDGFKVDVKALFDSLE